MTTKALNDMPQLIALRSDPPGPDIVTQRKSGMSLFVLFDVRLSDDVMKIAVVIIVWLLVMPPPHVTGGNTGGSAGRENDRYTVFISCPPC